MADIPLENLIVEILKKKRSPLSSEDLVRLLKSELGVKRPIDRDDLRKPLMKLEIYGVIRVYSRKGTYMIELVEGM